MTFPPQPAIALFKATPGAMSVCEMIAVHNLILQAPAGGVFCSLGSHAGKDSIAATSGMTGGRYHLVDPCYDLSNAKAWSQAVQKDSKNMPWGYVNDSDFNDKVKKRITEANPQVEPVLVGEASLDALEAMSKHQGFTGFSYVFSDSDDHNYDLIKAENNFLTPRMIKGGIICFHDYGNYSAPVQIHKELVASGQYENVSIPWDEIKAFVSSENLEASNNTWHCCEVALPCFAAAVRKL